MEQATRAIPMSLVAVVGLAVLVTVPGTAAGQFPLGGALRPGGTSTSIPLSAVPGVPSSEPGALVGAPNFTLAGVIVVDGEVKIAYLAEPVLTGGEPRAVRKGEQIGPYRLVEGSDDRVILESGGQQVVVMLGHGGTGSAAGAGPAVSAPTPTPPRAAGPLPDPTSAPTQASGRMGGLGAESPPGDQAEQDPVKAGQERLRNWIQGLKQASEDPAARERLFKRE